MHSISMHFADVTNPSFRHDINCYLTKSNKQPLWLVFLMYKQINCISYPAIREFYKKKRESVTQA